MNKCPNCGAPLPIRGNRCDYCGSVQSVDQPKDYLFIPTIDGRNVATLTAAVTVPDSELLYVQKDLGKFFVERMLEELPKYLTYVYSENPIDCTTQIRCFLRLVEPDQKGR